MCKRSGGTRLTALDAGTNSYRVSAAEIGFVNAVQHSIHGSGRKAVFFRPLANGLALVAQRGFEFLCVHL
nr:MAG TPA: hypothetical protein [Caudoviricetes sp.]